MISFQVRSVRSTMISFQARSVRSAIISFQARPVRSTMISFQARSVRSTMISVVHLLHNHATSTDKMICLLEFNGICERAYNTWTFLITLLRLYTTIIAPPRDKTNKVSVRPAKAQISLSIRVFAVRSVGSYGPKLSSCGQRRL